ncbi:hypothetical protein [Hymenobacter sublimis]|uniref:Uncharacterized protein n=1 Tax=Hymenobacter sublimis TaxID=2933777 RepID=A0ABY4J692_9BACT|nr:hypothetical protein [Hymenobacter sublimis]UPL48150.1 hypothetical protein MWH26_13245 [Hymenobacter sublimis]
MKQGTLRICASTDDYSDDLRTFDVVVVKDKLESHVSFLEHIDTWREFGRELVRFPESSSAKVVLQMGDISSYDSYLKLQAYCFDAYGHAAIHVSVDNRKPDPNRCKLEFSIPAEIASINRLGHLLGNWRVENDPEILWQAITS